ncbi:MAG: hypothetical protein HAW59_01840 [Betaproteobacteria bacterium]|nr:hypothetical protein [Betaproteobacteria bacterium]
MDSRLRGNDGVGGGIWRQRAGMAAAGGKYKFTPPAALRRGVEIRKANFRGAERDNEKAPSTPTKSQKAALAKIRQTEKIRLTTPPPGNLRGQIATPLRQTAAGGNKQEKNDGEKGKN